MALRPKSIAPSTVTAYLMLGPVTALLLGALFLDEPLSVSSVAGMAVLGGGLWLTIRPPGTLGREQVGVV